MKHYTRSDLEVAQSIGYYLNKARNRLLTDMNAALRPHKINGQQMGIMLSLARGLAKTPFELAKVLDIDTGVMTRMLDKLEGQGVLQRQRNLEDRRVVNLTLTKDGERIVKQIVVVAPEVLNRRLRNFSAQEFSEFQRLLQKFSEEDS